MTFSKSSHFLCILVVLQLVMSSPSNDWDDELDGSAGDCIPNTFTHRTIDDLLRYAPWKEASQPKLQAAIARAANSTSLIVVICAGSVVSFNAPLRFNAPIFVSLECSVVSVPAACSLNGDLINALVLLTYSKTKVKDAHAPSARRLRPFFTGQVPGIRGCHEKAICFVG